MSLSFFFRLAFCLFLVFFQREKGQSQSHSNPFELSHRLPEGLAAKDSSLAGDENPFDLAPHRLAVRTAPRREKATWLTPRIALPKGQSRNPSFLFAAIFGMLGLLTTIISLYRPTVRKVFKSFANDNFLSMTQREVGTVAASPYGLLYANFLLNVGIFAFLLTRWFRGDTFNNFPFLLLCIAGMAGVFLARHAILGLVGWAFPVEKEVSKYQFTITVFNCAIGLLLVPMNIFLAYAPPELARVIIWAEVAVIGGIFLFLAARGFSIGAKFLAAAQFHFLLYLCAVEIAPLLTLIKLALAQPSAR